MKKTILCLLFVLSSVMLVGCKSDNSLYMQAYEAGFEENSENADNENYWDFDIITSYADVTTYINEDTENVNYRFSEELQTYDEAFFSERYLVICYVVWRAYSKDFFIKKQEKIGDTLSIDIQYYIPWYTFGDSYNKLYAIIYEFQNSVTITNVAIQYVSR